MNTCSSGYPYSQNQVESKWRLHNISQTGTKRKSFQYFEGIDDIVRKRQDINPPYIQGSGATLPKQTKFMAKHNAISVDSDIQFEKENTKKKKSCSDSVIIS